MATQATRQQPTDGNVPELDRWRDSTRVVLQPIAAPSILGLFGFAAATFMVSTNIAGWYGSARSPLFLFPFAAICGGFVQFAASMWAHRARDAVASAVHGMWGSFWIGYGILWLLVAVGALTVPTGAFPALAFWFFPLAAITLSAAVAATGENLAVTATLVALGAGAALLGVGYLVNGSTWLHVGAWVLFASAVLAFYTATAMMWKASFGRVILPLGEPSAQANIPGHGFTHPIEFHGGEPGVRQGQ